MGVRRLVTTSPQRLPPTRRAGQSDLPCAVSVFPMIFPGAGEFGALWILHLIAFMPLGALKLFSSEVTGHRVRPWKLLVLWNRGWRPTTRGPRAVFMFLNV